MNQKHVIRNSRDIEYMIPLLRLLLQLDFQAEEYIHIFDQGSRNVWTHLGRNMDLDSLSEGLA